MTADTPRSGSARAKVNLTLHVTGQRGDGYHLLDSLVVFADLGDLITVAPSDALSLEISGPFGAGLDPGADNLILRAAEAIAPDRTAAITLQKNLPLASGIGGGSADAAATLILLSDLWGLPLPEADRVTALGADVPVCLRGQSCRMQGIGQDLSPVPSLASLPAILVNCGKTVSTPQVFGAVSNRQNAPMPDSLPDLSTPASAAAFLKTQRNDLESAAVSIVPEIAQTLAELNQLPGARLARMSGSGGTCFALFDTIEVAQNAAELLSAAHEDWWVKSTVLAA